MMNMIVYRKTVNGFINSCQVVNPNGECVQIGDEIATAMRNAGILGFGKSQETAWRKSL